MQTIKKLIALGVLFPAAVLLVGARSAAADPIQANTSGVFGGSCATCVPGGASLTSTNATGSSTISFSSSVPELIANPAPGQIAYVTLGVLNSTSTVPSGTLGGPSFTGATFTLTVNVTLPNNASPNPQTFSGVLQGQIVAGASTTFVEWVGSRTLTFVSVTSGTFTLTIEEQTPVNTPLDPDHNRIRATVTFVGSAVSSAEIPEPATWALLSAGLIGVAHLVRKRKRGKCSAIP
jgi:hypothetical protein